MNMYRYQLCKKWYEPVKDITGGFINITFCEDCLEGRAQYHV